jgi:hypothetical protein
LSPVDALNVINHLNNPQPVAAVAAPATLGATWSETHLIGAALDIEPRYQPSSATRPAVDQVFVDAETAAAQDLALTSPASSSWTADAPQPAAVDLDLDGDDFVDDGLLDLVAQAIHDLPDGEE